MFHIGLLVPTFLGTKNTLIDSVYKGYQNAQTTSYYFHLKFALQVKIQARTNSERQQFNTAYTQLNQKA